MKKQMSILFVIISSIVFLSVGWSQYIEGYTKIDMVSQKSNDDTIDLFIVPQDTRSRDLIWTTGQMNLHFFYSDSISFIFDYNGGYENILLEIETGMWNGSGDNYFELRLNGYSFGEFWIGEGFNSPGPEYNYINIDEQIQIGDNTIEFLALDIDNEGVLGYITIYGDYGDPSLTITVDYLSDWNLVGLPLEVENASYTYLFPESIEETLYSFDDGYNLETSLIQGEGYWLRFNNAGSTTISGTPINELTISLNEGWNLISGITNPVDVSDIQDPSGIIIPGTVYGFSFNGYSNADSIEPGKGYWLRTYQSGDIILISQTPATVTDIDGNVYNTVSIGDQLWMAENLKVTHYKNGDEIPYSYNDPQYGAYAEYSNDASNVAVYGRLYNWFAVNDARGLCPVDWQVPSDDELQELEMYLGMSESEANSEGLRGTDEGGKLKEEGTEHWNSPNTGATNETGFTALPGGRRDYDSYTDQEVWCCLNRYGFFWSSSEIYSVNAWYRALSFDYAESNRYHLNKRNGFSVRCVKD